MAWGIWNKIKQGFKKAGQVIKDGAKYINNKVIKPFKPLIKQAVNTFVPGAGKYVDALSDGVDQWTSGDTRGALKTAVSTIKPAAEAWANTKFKR